MPPNCKSCGLAHYNFESCIAGAARAEQRQQADRERRSRDEAHLKPAMTAPPGFHWLPKHDLKTVELRGDMIVSTSGLKLKTGKLSYPEGGEQQ